MKKNILTIILSLLIEVFCIKYVSGAEWQYFGDNKFSVFYISPTSIQSENTKSKIWIMIDFPKPLHTVLGKPVISEKNGKTVIVKSIVQMEEFDCEMNRQHSITEKYFDENMGKGTVVDLKQDTDWIEVGPQSVADELKTFACSKMEYLTESDDATFYINPKSIVKKEGYTQILLLVDLKSPMTAKKHNKSFTYNSIVNTMEFECDKNKKRMISSKFFSAPKGMGRLVDSSGTSEWSEVMPESISQNTKQYACK